MTAMHPDVELCRQSLKEGDYEQYLLSLFLPPEIRRCMWAVGAFRLTLDQIPSSVSQPALGYMRLTWWRDQLETMRSGHFPAGQPILSALHVISEDWEESKKSKIISMLQDMINEYEKVIEQEDAQNFAPSEFHKIMKEISGTSGDRYQKLSDYMTKLLKRYHGTRWEKRPPFLALRLWGASFILT